MRIPEGVDDARLRQELLAEFGIEIGAGLGPFRGTVWRIGLMGYYSRANNVLLLSALEQLLARQRIDFRGGASIAAATESLAAHQPPYGRRVE